jgi:hypothetical protein
VVVALDACTASIISLAHLIASLRTTALRDEAAIVGHQKPRVEVERRGWASELCRQFQAI